MIKKTILLIFIICYINTLFAQSTFKHLFKSPLHQTIGDIIETNDSCIIFPLVSVNPTETKLIKMNVEGAIVDSLMVKPLPNVLFRLIKYNDNSFFIAGAKRHYPENDTFWLCKYDYEFNLLKELTVPAYGQVYWNFIPLYINDKNNLVTNFLSFKSDFDAQTCVMEISPDCEIVKQKTFTNSTYWDYTCSIIQKNKYYYFFVGGSLFEKAMQLNIYKLDTSFNNYGFINLPAPYSLWDLHTTKWLNDSVFLLSGFIAVDNPAKTKVIKIKADTALLQAFKMIEIKDSDSSIRIAWYNNLDFIDVNNIFVGGWMYKTLPDYYQHVNTSFVLTKIDSTLNIKWQRKYGGDGYYELFGLKATQDGGCVMGGTYYGPEQNNEKDPFIMKVDGNGNISWVHNLPDDFTKLTVYPNPGSNEMIVNNPPLHTRLVLYGINSKKLIEQNLDIANSINTEDLNSGMYLYQIVDCKGKIISSGKWVKSDR